MGAGFHFWLRWPGSHTAFGNTCQKNPQPVTTCNAQTPGLSSRLPRLA